MKTTEPGGTRGDDGGKKITGLKRHVNVDILGLLLAAVDDATAAPKVLARLGSTSYARLTVVWVDNQYHNHALNQWIDTDSPGTCRLEVMRRPPGAKGFVLLPKVIPADYDGVMVTDRGRSYDAQAFDAVHQQKCMAHVQRSIRDVLETKAGRARDFGEGLKGLLQDALELWHEHRAGHMTELKAEAEALQQAITS